MVDQGEYVIIQKVDRFGHSINVLHRSDKHNTRCWEGYVGGVVMKVTKALNLHAFYAWCPRCYSKETRGPTGRFVR